MVPRAYGIPVRRAQTGKGGDHVATVGIRHLAGQILRFCRAVQKVQLVPQPLDGGTSRKHGALQGIRAPFHPGPRRWWSPGRSESPQACPRCSSAESSRCRRYFWPPLAGSRPGRTGRPAGPRLHRRWEWAPPNQPGSVMPYTSLLGRTSGSMHRGIPSSSRISSVPLQGVDVEEHGPGGIGGSPSHGVCPR